MIYDKFIIFYDNYFKNNTNNDFFLNNSVIYSIITVKCMIIKLLQLNIYQILLEK